MKIVLFGITENESPRGVERYIYETAKALARTPGVSSVRLVAGGWQEYFKDLTSFGVDIAWARDLSNTKINRHIFHLLKLKDYTAGFDIAHVCNTLPIPPTTTVPIFITIHDIAEYFVPEKYSRAQVFYRKMVSRYSANRATRIITVSEFSKSQISKILRIPESKIVVTYNGHEHFTSKEPVKPETIFSDDFVFYWGTIERSKGIINTIHAFNRVQANHKNLKLVVAGGRGNAWPEFSSAIKENRSIIYKGHISDAHLKYLLERAKVVVFPSIYEGFGLPALEAFCLNSNVITSNSSALGEIGERFATTVDPVNIEALAEAIQQLLEDPKVFSDEKRSEILKNFSWIKSAEILSSTYSGLLNEVRNGKDKEFS